MSIKERTSYQSFVSTLKGKFNDNKALESAIGDGDFDAIGLLERELLIASGLPSDGYLIDIGCGSGRLTKPLSNVFSGRYLGVDIVPDLVNHAKKLAERDDWEFKTGGEEFTIPEKNETADMICFFSVFTHLLHEQTFLYLQDAKRVLKPGGKIVFSFLEFKIEEHWRIFRDTVKNIQNTLMNQFIDRDGIRFWAKELDLEVVSINDGDKAHFIISQPIKLAEGHIMKGKGNLGQSVCILVKPKI